MPNTLLQTLVGRKHVQNFRKKILNSKVVGTLQSFDFADKIPSF